MPRVEVEEFARLLVERVRDAAIENAEVRLAANSNSPVAKRWRRAAAEESFEQLARMVVLDSIDDAVFYLLNSIDQGLLQLLFKASSGVTVDLLVDGGGEMGGWYMGADSWRSKYSKHECFDD